MKKKISKIKICLTNVTNDQFMTGSPMNLLYLGSYLIEKNLAEKKNITIKVTHQDDFLKFVKKLKPHVIGLSANTPFYMEVKKLVLEIRKFNKKAIIVLGGYHISSLPNSLPAKCDFGVIGEGEETFAQIIKVINDGEEKNIEKLSKIESLIYRDKKKKLHINKLRAALNITSFKQLHWDLIERKNLYANQAIIINNKTEIKKITILYTSRGCPFNCSFCAHRVIWKGVRYFNIKTVCDEMELLYKKYGIDCFQIMDDTFAISKARLKQFIKELKNRKLLGKLSFYYLFIRADLIDEEFTTLLKEFGTISVFIGVEFGSSRVMKLYKDGDLTIDKAKKACRLFAKKNITVFSSFMLFNPTEKEDEIMETYEIAKWFTEQSNSIGIGFSVTTPYPGTKLWPYHMAKNKVKKERWSNYLMFNANSGSREMSHVFFSNGLTYHQCLNIWRKFSKLSEDINQRLEERYSLKKYYKKVDRLNSKMITRDEILKKIKRLQDDPMKYIKKTIFHPLFIYKKIRQVLGLKTKIVRGY